ncbi:MAG: sigma-70 family RNA polymerase sigma factor [Deltaproteobacteria bacterium]|nr:sigma-70 family RNA polymerase sigma factor [Deltaproteobacteria bacterium]
MSDEDLVKRLREGDISAFDELYRRYHRRLFGYVARQVRDGAQAEDLFQEIFLTVLEDRSFDLSQGRFAAWLFTVARNRCLNALRSDQRQRRALARAADEERAATRSPDDLSQTLARGRTLQGAIERLSTAHQQVLLLKQVGELSYREIAEVQQVPEGTVKSRVHAAIAALRGALDEEEQWDG